MQQQQKMKRKQTKAITAPQKAITAWKAITCAISADTLCEIASTKQQSCTKISVPCFGRFSVGPTASDSTDTSVHQNTEHHTNARVLVLCQWSQFRQKIRAVNSSSWVWERIKPPTSWKMFTYVIMASNRSKLGQWWEEDLSYDCMHGGGEIKVHTATYLNQHDYAYKKAHTWTCTLCFGVNGKIRQVLEMQCCSAELLIAMEDFQVIPRRSG